MYPGPSILSITSCETSQKLLGLMVVLEFLKTSKLILKLFTLSDNLTETGKLFQYDVTRLGKKAALSLPISAELPIIGLDIILVPDLPT